MCDHHSCTLIDSHWRRMCGVSSQRRMKISKRECVDQIRECADGVIGDCLSHGWCLLVLTLKVAALFFRDGHSGSRYCEYDVFSDRHPSGQTKRWLLPPFLLDRNKRTRVIRGEIRECEACALRRNLRVLHLWDSLPFEVSRLGSVRLEWTQGTLRVSDGISEWHWDCQSGNHLCTLHCDGPAQSMAEVRLVSSLNHREREVDFDAAIQGDPRYPGRHCWVGSQFQSPVNGDFVCRSMFASVIGWYALIFDGDCRFIRDCIPIDSSGWNDPCLLTERELVVQGAQHWAVYPLGEPGSFFESPVVSDDQPCLLSFLTHSDCVCCGKPVSPEMRAHLISAALRSVRGCCDLAVRLNQEEPSSNKVTLSVFQLKF